MRATRVLIAMSVLAAAALSPTMSASASDQLTWPQVQAAAQAAQTNVTQGGGTVTDEITAKISYRQFTDYRPGGSVMRARYREAGMMDSEPDEVTWTIIEQGVAVSYRPMPELPKTGPYPTMRKASWMRLDPTSGPDSTPPLLRLTAYEPTGTITSSAPAADGIISSSWTHGVDGFPDSAVTATFTQLSTGALILRSFSTTDLHPNGPGFTQQVQVDFTNPMLVVPKFTSALPKGYVDAGMAAARGTTMAFYSVRNAASSAREKAATMSRAKLTALVRRQVVANDDVNHPSAEPSTNLITDVPNGVRLTNPNAYSGQSTIWTITVSPDKQVVLSKRTTPSKVVLVRFS
jgi:hypothetical protein